MNRERFSRRAPAWGGAYDASLMARRQPVARMPGDFVMRLSSADTVYMMVGREHRLALSSMTPAQLPTALYRLSRARA